MKKFFRISVFTVIVVFLFGLKLNAQDTVTVQTFTFQDIYKRSGKFLFPNKDQTYRKILMLYTLKCDPQTPWDKYNCGEWDYLTYNLIYTPTGVLSLLVLPACQAGVRFPVSMQRESVKLARGPAGMIEAVLRWLMPPMAIRLLPRDQTLCEPSVWSLLLSRLGICRIEPTLIAS